MSCSFAGDVKNKAAPSLPLRADGSTREKQSLTANDLQRLLEVARCALQLMINRPEEDLQISIHPESHEAFPGALVKSDVAEEAGIQIDDELAGEGGEFLLQFGRGREGDYYIRYSERIGLDENNGPLYEEYSTWKPLRGLRD